MSDFNQFNLSKQLNFAIDDLGFKEPTPIQEEAFNVILSGKDVVGIAQTGTGKTFAYMLPILQSLKFSKQKHPRVLILVPTRELVLQVVENINSFSKYITHRVLGVYGGTNINTQKTLLLQGQDIIVATPGRLYDLILSRAVSLKTIKQLVIDEVDVMLDLGFRFQLTNIFDLLPQKRQNIMFSATMTDDVSVLIDDFFTTPVRIEIALSGTPLSNISQECYKVLNFYTKINLLAHLIRDKEEFKKVLIFVAEKKNADRVFDALQLELGDEVSVIHANKTQNYRFRSIQEFDEGVNRILVATDVMARGLDLHEISHVISMDVPNYPENYMHRIGRTGRAEKKGKSILFYTQKERVDKDAVEELMDYFIPTINFPQDEVETSSELLPSERPAGFKNVNPFKDVDPNALPPGFHEKKDKNKKEVVTGSVRRRFMAAKYNKPITKGDKGKNERVKKNSKSRNKRS